MMTKGILGSRVVVAVLALFAAACEGRSSETPPKQDQSGPGVNHAPVANAGPDQPVTTGALVMLDGSGSSDADGDPLTYAWTLESVPFGSVAALSSASVMAPSFTPDLAGTYVLSLSVHDGTVAGPPDTVAIRASAPAPANVAPVAEAGPDQRVRALATVTLDGSGSSDADGDPLSFAWTITSKPFGSAADLTWTWSVGPTFLADLPGRYVVTLAVNDGTVDSVEDTVTVAVISSNWVPDSGQTASYTTTAGEDSDYSINGPHYTIGGDGSLRDDFTGLVWQQQDDATTRTWDAAVSYCATVGLPGSGWRLPSPYELLTITDFGRTNPALDTTRFTGGRAAYYWSGQQFRATSDAWLADFSAGGVLTAPKATPAYVRCVRGDTGPVFIANPFGTVKDEARGLTWQQADDGTKRTWDEALTYCQDLTLSVWSDWRLPNVKELASLEDFGRYPVADPVFFPTTMQSYYWSSTTVGSEPTTAWQASFLGGSVGSPGLVKANAAAYVRCVRGP